MPRDGALVLTDLRQPMLSVACEPCRRRGRYGVAKLIEQHGRCETDGPASGTCGLPEGALGQHLRPQRRSIASCCRKRCLAHESTTMAR